MYAKISFNVKKKIVYHAILFAHYLLLLKGIVSNHFTKKWMEKNAEKTIIITSEVIIMTYVQLQPFVF
jgi:hypothetical protein